MRAPDGDLKYHMTLALRTPFTRPEPRIIRAGADYCRDGEISLALRDVEAGIWASAEVERDINETPWSVEAPPIKTMVQWIIRDSGQGK